MAELRDLAECVRETDEIELQNRFMQLSVRELALAIFYMEPEEQQLFYRLLPRPKRIRLSQELAYAERLEIGWDKCLKSARYILSVIDGSGKASGLRSYIRPPQRPK